MQRIQHITHQVDKFGVGKPGFKDGDPVAGIPATIPGAVSFDSYQEELMSVIETAGLTPSGSDYTQVLQGILRLIALSLGGINTGIFGYGSASTVTLSRAHRGIAVVDVDGTLFTVSASDITWDITANLDTGSEAASTWYYCYLANISGVLTPKVSATAPSMTPPAKVGYHPTNTGWRFVQAFRNDASSNIIPFDTDANGRIVYRRRAEDAVQVISLAATAPTTYQLVSLATVLPATATAALLIFEASADGALICLGHRSLSGLTASTNKGARLLLATNNGTANSPTANSLEFLFPVDATPNLAWGRDTTAILETETEYTIYVVGWK